MFYITDYTTKVDLKTHEMLSLMSQAVASASNTSIHSEVEQAKMSLYKCFSQFSHQQQIHTQKAARYLRGLNDTMMSHKVCAVS